MANTALLLIDLQNDYFEGGKWTLSGTEAAAAEAAGLLARFRELGRPVVHVRHEFPSDEAPFFQPGSQGAQIHPSVAPLADEAVVVKQQVNSFRDTELKAVLDELNVDKLVIVGAMTQNCIDAVVRAAVDMGYECTVAHDACATLDLEFNGMVIPAAHVHGAFMAALGFAYARVAATGELLDELADIVA